MGGGVLNRSFNLYVDKLISLRSREEGGVGLTQNWSLRTKLSDIDVLLDTLKAMGYAWSTVGPQVQALELTLLPLREKARAFTEHVELTSLY